MATTHSPLLSTKKDYLSNEMTHEHLHLELPPLHIPYKTKHRPGSFEVVAIILHNYLKPNHSFHVNQTVPNFKLGAVAKS